LLYTFSDETVQEDLTLSLFDTYSDLIPWGRILGDQPTELFTTHRSGTSNELSPEGSLGDWLNRALKYVQDVVRKLEAQFEACSPLAGDNVLDFGHENAPKLLVGRPGLDPGTLGVFRECPGVSLNVQICWPEEVECSSTSSEVPPSLNSWLDNWLDKGSFRGVGTIQFRGANGEVLALRRGE
jgi:hypothetical protein